MFSSPSAHSIMSTTHTHLTMMSLVRSGVRFHWRTSLAVALGVAVATAVIVGALLVGDSMRGSLRALTVERLGEIDSVVAPGGFFSANDAAKTLGVAESDLATVVLFDRAVIETIGQEGVRRAGAVQTIGCDESFWKLDVSGVAPETMPNDQSIVLTAALASELGVEIGDQVTVRLPVEQAVPADSPLGRRDTQTEGIPRLNVVDILPDRGLARFSLSPAQATPKNVFLSRDLVAEVLDRKGQANVALSTVPIDDDALQVSLADLGLTLQRFTKRFEDETVFDYYSITSDRLLVNEDAVDTITKAMPAGTVTATMTYLANAIERVDDSGTVTHSVPYSTITATDSSDEFPLDYTVSAEDTKPTRDAVPMVLNSWTAERLDASVGTPLRVGYFEPEVENGKEIERYFDAVVTQVVPITEPAKRYFRTRAAVFDSRPTRYNDPNLTPTVPGVTDQDSISDWDLPFKLTREISSDDDRYWNNHRLTPKAFLPLADGQRLFGSRFGQTTSLRLSLSASDDTESLAQSLREATRSILGELGWHARSIKQAQLAASKGTTPFDGLFLALSFFVIFAAVMLIAMLFRLGLVARSKELGTLMAVGLQRKQVSRSFLLEGVLIAAAGALLGLAGGIAYAVIVLAALRTYWVGAVTVPFLTFHASPTSLIGGTLIGLGIGAATLWWTLRSMLRNQTMTLLRGRDDSDQSSIGSADSSNRWLRKSAIGLFVVALIAGAVGAMSGGQMAAGAFVGGGMMLLIAMLVLIYDSLKHRVSQSNPSNVTGYSIGRLANSNSARAPLRSTLTIGLMASAAFLIVAITAFRLQPTDAGTGGFDLVADAAQPLYEDLSDPAVRAGLLGPDADVIADATVVPLRVRTGQDASCNNLYQATEPTLLGVPSRMADKLGQFRFYAAANAEQPDQTAWHLLDRKASGGEDDPIPVIIDQNTAMWSLQMIKGVGERKSFVYDNATLHFKVVGLLENSLLQGRLIIGEENFEACFPDISGYRFVMIDSPSVDSSEMARVLETRLGDIGFDASDAREVLSGMMAVQNTYLRTFQSLGGLGLLLGTLGLAISQVRNVLERRSELAVMRAVGFTPRRLATLVMGETASLLLLGVGCGVFCAIVAVLPYTLTSGMSPPILEPVMLVGGILLIGLIAGVVAATKVVRLPLLDSLRGT